MSKNFKNKTILITGATGSFGKTFIKHILKKKLPFRKIIVFSRDELKQHEMKVSKDFNELKNKQLRFFIGDIRDKDRLIWALKDVDYVIHAAALKQVPTGEYNPFEVIKTNVIGAQNIIEASISNNVKKVISLSTDKAVSPENFMVHQSCAQINYLFRLITLKEKKYFFFRSQIWKCIWK